MELKIFTDGGSLNNPGQAAISYIIYLDNKIVQKFSKRIGINTNNFAEYSALYEALCFIKTSIFEKQASRILKISCFSDSNLLVNQLKGMYKVKNTAIRDFIIKIRVLEQQIQTPIVYIYIPREKNTLADSLIKKELNFYS